MREHLGIWHRWHMAIAVALVGAWACGGKETGAGGGAAAFAPCQADAECASRSCVDGACAAPAGTGGTTAGDSGVPGSGGDGTGGAVGNDGGAGGLGVGGSVGGGGAGRAIGGGGGFVGGSTGCPGGAYAYSGGATATGGSGGTPPSAACVLDSTGAAGAPLDELCGLVRCPAHEADLLAGMDCTEVVPGPVDGITLATGCGTETVRFAGAGTTYEATFDATSGAMTTVRAGWEYSIGIGDCTWSAFRAGDAPPACVTATWRRCTRPAGTIETELPACREPLQDGCATCCEPNFYDGRDYCNVWTTQGPPGMRYDFSGGMEGTCPCNCRPCASCTTERDHLLRTMPEMPQCDCPALPPPGTGGTTGAGGATSAGGAAGASTGGSGGAAVCDNYCAGLAGLQRQCPDVPR